MSNDGENLHIFWKTWEISIKFSRKMWLIIDIRNPKQRGLHPFSKRCSFGKATKGSNSLSRLKIKKEILQVCIKFYLYCCFGYLGLSNIIGWEYHWQYMKLLVPLILCWRNVISLESYLFTANLFIEMLRTFDKLWLRWRLKLTKS